jgi:hypothetical protein
MMMEIMEPETASAKPNVIVLMKPERVAFLKRKGKPLRKKSATQSPERHNMGQEGDAVEKARPEVRRNQSDSIRNIFRMQSSIVYLIEPLFTTLLNMIKY